MIRGFFRLVGLLLLAGGFIFMVYDGARWVADQTLRFTRFGEFWNDVHQSSQIRPPHSLQRYTQTTVPLAVFGSVRYGRGWPSQFGQWLGASR